MMLALRLFVCLAVASTCFAEPIPRLARENGHTHLVVNNQPFLLLGGQLHNSSGWPSRLDEALPQLNQMHANTVEIPVYWETIEPQPGQWDFTLVDAIIERARKHHLRVALLWFATWKNGVMDYAPAWVKSDPKTYPRMVDEAGHPIRVLSPHSRSTLEADKRAFVELMRHLLRVDGEARTVIMVQVQNEPGSLGAIRDYSPEANRLFAGAAPPALLTALKKPGGTWRQVFGVDADEAFAAYHVARYVDEVAAAGKAVYPLPMTVNVWLRERKGFMRPGDAYPSGGPTSNVLDIWKAAAPSVDIIAPDIYVTDYAGYQEVCRSYARPDNPLFIPETGGSGAFARYLFYALGDHRAIGFAPFGVDSPGNKLNERLSLMAANYALLAPAGAQILALQSANKLRSLVEEDQYPIRFVTFDRWEVVAYFGTISPSYGGYYAAGTKDRTGRVLVGELGPDEFWIAGFDGRVLFKPKPQFGREAQFVRVEEGQFENGVWKMQRLWNGDQAFFGVGLPANGVMLKVKLMPY